MKIFSIQIKIGLLLIFAVVLLSATCYLSYRNISSISSSIQIKINPEIRLVSIWDISRDLENADSKVRIYSITGDSSDLKPYYAIIDGIGKKVAGLRSECSDDPVLRRQADTIGTLIKENIKIWNELIYIVNNDSVRVLLKQLTNKAETPEETERKGLLKRVFNREKPDNLKNQELVSNLQEIEQQDSISKERQKARQLELATTSSRIKEKFYDLIVRMENQVRYVVREKGQAAGKIAEKTYGWLIMFSISGGLLAIIVLLIIIRYIRNASKYQIALEKAKDEAENLSRTRELFMANISHEIRTPVTAISGFTEQLMHETSDENVLRSLKIIKSSSDHLVNIIEDILDLSRLQNGKLTLEVVYFGIKQILDEIIDLFKQRVQENNAVISYSVKPGTPEILMGDPYRIKQILINLVGNSVKFTESGSIKIMAEGIPGKDDDIDLKLEVIDTGIGIDEDKLKIIFDDFTQAEMSTTRKYGGTGLGLSIVKKLIELHKGTIACKSRKGFGTTITCMLPLRTGVQDRGRKDIIPFPEVPDRIRDLKVLVVDDEEYNRLLFKKILSKWGLSCTEAENGAEAIDLLKNNKFDLLFMDIRMPGMDGINVTQFIRNELKIKTEEMQIICISAISRTEKHEKSIASGMDAFLQKPFTEENLLSAIMEVRYGKSHAEGDDRTVTDKIKEPEKDKIRIDNLLHISGGDTDFIRQMLTSFNKTTAAGLREMHDAAIQKDRESVGYLAHKLLSPCNHLGAKKLYDLLSEIEDGITGKTEMTKIRNLIKESEREFGSIKELVNTYLEEMS